MADTLEALARRDGRISERKFDRTLTYGRDKMMIVFDFEAGGL